MLPLVSEATFVASKNGLAPQPKALKTFTNHNSLQVSNVKTNHVLFQQKLFPQQ